jgi:hypothetical protein
VRKLRILKMYCSESCAELDVTQEKHASRSDRGGTSRRRSNLRVVALCLPVAWPNAITNAIGYAKLSTPDPKLHRRPIQPSALVNFSGAAKVIAMNWEMISAIGQMLGRLWGSSCPSFISPPKSAIKTRKAGARRLERLDENPCGESGLSCALAPRAAIV